MSKFPWWSISVSTDKINNIVDDNGTWSFNGWGTPSFADSKWVIKGTWTLTKAEGGGTVIYPPLDSGNDDAPSVDPEDSEPPVPTPPVEDEITGDAPGSDALGAGGEVIDSDPMGDPDVINGDDAEEDIAAAPNGVKTGDESDMIPWALGFGSAIMLLGGTVALRRREEE